LQSISWIQICSSRKSRASEYFHS